MSEHSEEDHRPEHFWQMRGLQLAALSGLLLAIGLIAGLREPGQGEAFPAAVVSEEVRLVIEQDGTRSLAVAEDRVELR